MTSYSFPSEPNDGDCPLEFLPLFLCRTKSWRRRVLVIRAASFLMRWSLHRYTSALIT